MGHSTSSGRQSGQEREIRNAVQNGKVNAGQSRQGLSESAQRAIRATEYSARQQEEKRRRGREAARNMTSRRRR